MLPGSPVLWILSSSLLALPCCCFGSLTCPLLRILLASTFTFCRSRNTQFPLPPSKAPFKAAVTAVACSLDC